MEKKANKEFVPEYFNWIGLEDQKKRAEELSNMTNKNKK